MLDALRYRQQQHNWRIYGYVILENHLHLLVQADDLPNQLAHFKSYTARQLIDYLKTVKAERLLQQLSLLVPTRRVGMQTIRASGNIQQNHQTRSNEWAVVVTVYSNPNIHIS